MAERNTGYEFFEHATGSEVKGVMYHQFHVRQAPRGWEAQVIFDV